MNNLSKEKKQQLAMVAIVTIVICVGIWFGLIASQKNQKAAMDKKTAELRQKVESAQKLIKQGAAIQEESEEARAELARREETMASGDLYQWFLTRMIPATSSSGLINFTPNSPTLMDTRLLPKFPYRSASYAVKISGHFHDFGRFIADLENEYPYARIQNLDISAAPGLQAEERLNFAFDFVTLYHTNRAVSVR